MELKITEQKEEKLLSRICVKGDISFQGVTPSKEELRNRVAVALKVDDKLVVIKNIRTSFGGEKGKVVAYKYDTEDDLKRIEPRKKVKGDAPPAEGETNK